MVLFCATDYEEKKIKKWVGINKANGWRDESL